MGEGELADVTQAMKCEHYDRRFCKYNNDRIKVHPNMNCRGNCENKRTGPVSCDLLHFKAMLNQRHSP